jgi:hypothetical protein
MDRFSRFFMRKRFTDILGLSRLRRRSFAAIRMTFIVMTALVLLIGVVRPAAAEDGQQVWIVSTRNAPRCGELDATLESLEYCRMDTDCRWIASDAETFRASGDAAVPTILFFHGNRTDADYAIEKACYAYEFVRAESGGRPFRYVIWSWPAERMMRSNRNDVHLKAAYSDVESYYLAQWLDRVPSGMKVSLVGHSFGPRIIAGALQLLAGGELAGRNLPKETVAAWQGGRRNPIRVALLAAAIDADSLAPAGQHGLALSLVDRMLVTCNGCDRVLRHYPRMDGRGGPDAMGFTGPCGLDDPQKVDVFDVSCAVGRRHDWRLYCQALDASGLWPRYTFLEEAPPTNAP